MMGSGESVKNIKPPWQRHRVYNTNRSIKEDKLERSDKARKKGFFSPVWQLFVSVKLTVVVLLTIAAAASIGTLIPQNQPDLFYRMNFSETSYGIFSALDLFNLYDSLWFQSLILVLAVNIIVCSMDRLKIVWKIVFPKQKSFSPGAFSEKNTTQPVTVDKAPNALQIPFEKKLKKYCGATHLKPADDGFYLFGEKGRLSRLGVYVVHFSVLLLLCGTMISSIAGFEGRMNIPEGEKAREITLRNSQKEKTLDFAIRCDDFDVSFYESGRPKKYQSTLSIIENGNVVLTKDILVNKPLRYKGISIFQSSYGAADIKDVKLAFSSKKSGMTYHKTLKLGESAELPENLGTFTLERFTDRYMFMEEHSLGETLIGTLKRGETEQAVALPLRFERFDKMRRNADTFITIEDMSRTFYTGLQVRKDPGVPVVYASFILIIVGIYITFFMSHQQFCIHARGRENHTLVTVSAKANKNRIAARKKAESIRQALSQPPCKDDNRLRKRGKHS